MNKKIVVAVISILCVCAIAFAIYWDATEFSRYRNKEIDDISGAIAINRQKGDDFFVLLLGDELMNDEVFQEFLVTEIQKMYQNREFKMLNGFLKELEDEDIYSSLIVDTLNDCMSSSDDISSALEMIDRLHYLEYYNSALVLNKNTGVIAEYLSINGTNSISSTKGTGYYADEEDEESYERIGIAGSALHDSKEIIYNGDFKYVHEYGVYLNKTTYTEDRYSREYYYFRGTAIDFTPKTGECVWSGDYIFCFSENGTLLGCSKVT